MHRKSKSEQVSQYPAHVNFKDGLTLFFTSRLQHTRAAFDGLQHLSHKIVLGELLVRNILYYLLELPCVAES